MAIPAAPPSVGGQPRKNTRRRLIAVIIVIIAAIILIAALWPGSTGGGSGGVNMTGVTIQWSGQTYTLLSLHYSSSPSSGGYGNQGFTFNAEYIAGGECSTGVSECFSPDATFAISSLTPGFKVSWVTACYQSEGASALVGGPVYFKYSASPAAVPNGCSSYGDEVNMAGITPGSEVTITVAAQFPTSGYSGALALLATPTNLNSTANNGTYHQTSMSVSCTPSPVEMQGGAICAATVDDTTSTPTTPTGQVQFGSGTLGNNNLGSCNLAPATGSSSNSSATCAVQFTPQVNGEVTVSASYAGDSGHQGAVGSTSLSVFSITISITPDNQSVTKGQNATYAVTVTLGNGSVPASLPPIVLSAPACQNYFACTFSSASVIPTLAGNTTTLTIETAQVDVQLPASITFVVTGIPLNAENTTMTPIQSNNAAITVLS